MITKRIVEIDGVKIEVDMRTAKRIEHFKVGDNVRVLVPSYGKNFNVFSGVIVSFDEFQQLPTINVAYLETGYNTAEVKFVAINAAKKDDKVEIAPMEGVHETHFKKGDVLAIMEKEIAKKENEIQDLVRKKQYFEHYFAKYFDMTMPNMDEAVKPEAFTSRPADTDDDILS